MGSFYRTRGYRFNWSGFITPGVKVIVLACAGVFLVQTFALLIRPYAYGWLNWHFGLVPIAVTQGLHIWQPFTYFFLRGIGAGLINVIVKTIPIFWGSAPSVTPTIGASGAIFGILIANAILFPDRQIWLIPFPITIAMRPYVAVMGAIEFFSTLGSGGDNVAHVCHLGGMLVGYVYLRRGSFLYRARNRYTDWKLKRTRRKFEVYMRDHKNEPPSRPDRWVN